MRAQRPIESHPSETLSGPDAVDHDDREHGAEDLPAAWQRGAEASIGGAAASAEESNMNDAIVEELTNRLPTSELVKIIKGALECGKRNLPFTESEMLRAMTFGVNSTYVRSSREAQAPSSTSGTRRIGRS